MKKAIVTGASGFIGFFVCKKLKDQGFNIIGIDDLNDYYDLTLKKSRQHYLTNELGIDIINEKIQRPNFLKNLLKKEKPEIVIHLAAQAGVRYSISNPRSYFESNILGTFELLEAAKEVPPQHILLASTSSVYGGIQKYPYVEKIKTDHQLSFYAASKKSCEIIAHSYSHIHKIPITAFRFFTVYGPWGRPDMALFKFTKAILENQSIDLYNMGDMYRDFTYIEDLVHAMFLLISCVPDHKKMPKKIINDSLSPVAPFRVINIGNSKPEKLTDFISEIEKNVGRKAKKKLCRMQKGDVKKTWADTELLYSLTNYIPNTSIEIGVRNFVSWYKSYYNF